MRQPTRDAADGSMRETKMVTTIGNRIFSVFVT